MSDEPKELIITLTVTPEEENAILALLDNMRAPQEPDEIPFFLKKQAE